MRWRGRLWWHSPGGGGDGASAATSQRTAWRLCWLTVAACGAAMGVDVLDRSAQPFWSTAPLLIVPVGYAVIGVVITTRQPGNAIGWLFAWIGAWLAVTAGFAQAYAVYALLVNPGLLPGGQIALWLESPALDSLGFLWLFLLLLLFPDGRPLSPPWRLGVAAALCGSVLGLAQAFQPYHIDPPLDSFQNPYVAHGAVVTALDWAGGTSAPLLAGSFAAGVVSSILRYRRSEGVVRHQLRWFAAAVALIVVLIAAAVIVYVSTGSDVSNGVFPVAVMVLPVATCVAILRYRLYEIDVLIRKTLIYACLLAGLAGVYLGGIVGLGAAFRAVTGQSGALAVTASTLLVAACFQPLRARTQRMIDHRFYRGRYDAARTLDAFSGRLRQEIDVDALRAELLSLVEHTVQPEHTSLWLRSLARKP
jgi:hypothetical protein